MNTLITDNLKQIGKLFFILAILIASQAEAQQLNRKATLGLRASTLPDSLAKVYSLKSGVVITRVGANSTAEVLGVKQGDIILSINEKPTQTPAEVASISQLLTPGQTIKMQLLRDGKKKSIKGKAVAKPLEKAEHANVVYDQVAFRDGQLRTITYTPEAAGKHPAILFIPGFPCQSIDDYGTSAYNQLIKGVAQMNKRDLAYNKANFNKSLITETDAWMKRVMKK